MVVNTDPTTTPASTQGAHGPSDGLCISVSKSASLATKPRNGGSAAMLAVAAAAMHEQRAAADFPATPAAGCRGCRVAWSMMPTTMNSAALNIACAHSMVSPASISSPPPVPTSRVIRPSWLTVPNARISFRSYSRTARQPANSIVSRPSTTIDRPPRRRIGESGRQPGHQIHAGLDHGGGVQVGADRCRRGHRARQPEVHRHDRGLGQRADQNEHQGDVTASARRRLGHQFGQQVGAGALAEDDDPDQHRQAAGRGDHQRLGRRAAAGGPFGVVADEQERQHRRSVPRTRRAPACCR